MLLFQNKFIKQMLSSTPEDRPQAKDIKETLEKFFSLDQNLLSQKTIWENGHSFVESTQNNVSPQNTSDDSIDSFMI